MYNPYPIRNPVHARLRFETQLLKTRNGSLGQRPSSADLKSDTVILQNRAGSLERGTSSADADMNALPPRPLKHPPRQESLEG